MRLPMCTPFEEALRKVDTGEDYQIYISYLGAKNENVGFRLKREIRKLVHIWKPFISYTRRAKEPDVSSSARGVRNFWLREFARRIL